MKRPSRQLHGAAFARASNVSCCADGRADELTFRRFSPYFWPFVTSCWFSLTQGLWVRGSLLRRSWHFQSRTGFSESGFWNQYRKFRYEIGLGKKEIGIPNLRDFLSFSINSERFLNEIKSDYKFKHRQNRQDIRSILLIVTRNSKNREIRKIEKFPTLIGTLESLKMPFLLLCILPPSNISHRDFLMSEFLLDPTEQTHSPFSVLLLLHLHSQTLSNSVPIIHDSSSLAY